MKTPHLSVVIPAYNEERRIGAAIDAIHRYLTERGTTFEILVVEDGSRDRTAAIVGDYANRLVNVRLVRLAPNVGKGRAVREGMLAAAGRYVMFTDADQSTSIDQLPTLLTPIEAGVCDIAIGSRGIRGAVLVRRQPWYREALGKLFGCLLRVLLFRSISDTQCGFKCFTRAAARDIFAALTCTNGLFDMEALLLAGLRGYRVLETPVRWVHDRDSRLVYSPRQALGLVRELVRIRRHWQIQWPLRIPSVEWRRDTAASYQERDYLVREVDHYAGTKYDIILRWLGERPGARVLNVGCGSGELNVLLAERGYTVDAIDLSEPAVRLAERRARERGVAGVSIRRGDLFDLRAATPYDAVLCLDVIEHIKEERLALEHLASLLAPGGLLLISVPAMPFLFGYHDEQLGHVRRYSKAGVGLALEGLFAVERARYFGFSLIPIALLYSKLWRIPYPVRKSGGRFARAVLALERRLRFPAGTSLLVEARKTG